MEGKRSLLSTYYPTLHLTALALYPTTLLAYPPAPVRYLSIIRRVFVLMGVGCKYACNSARLSEGDLFDNDYHIINDSVLEPNYLNR